MGFEITKAALESGEKVIATSRNTDILLEKIVDHKDNLFPVELDITSEKDIQNAISNGIEKFGRIDESFLHDYQVDDDGKIPFESFWNT